MADWFTSLATQAMQMADSLAEQLVQQANQVNVEQKKFQEENQANEISLTKQIQMPWETDDEELCVLSQDLMEKIFSLSLYEENFTLTPPNIGQCYFNFKDFVPVALQLLKVDTNLARIHAKLSPKMNEEILWQHYYCRVWYLRALVGMEGPAAQHSANALSYQEMIYTSTSVNANQIVGTSNDSNDTKPKVVTNKTKKNLPPSSLSEEVESALRDDSGFVESPVTIKKSVRKTNSPLTSTTSTLTQTTPSLNTSSSNAVRVNVPNMGGIYSSLKKQPPPTKPSNEPKEVLASTPSTTSSTEKVQITTPTVAAKDDKPVVPTNKPAVSSNETAVTSQKPDEESEDVDLLEELDLDPDDYEQIEKDISNEQSSNQVSTLEDDDDAELERQIARELAAELAESDEDGGDHPQERDEDVDDDLHGLLDDDDEEGS